MCEKEGPAGKCQKSQWHGGLHEHKDENGKTSMWTDDWRKNDNRTTWRA